MDALIPLGMFVLLGVVAWRAIDSLNNSRCCARCKRMYCTWCGECHTCDRKEDEDEVNH